MCRCSEHEFDFTAWAIRSPPLFNFEKSNVISDKPYPTFTRCWEIQSQSPWGILSFPLSMSSEVLRSLRHLGRVLWSLVSAVTYWHAYCSSAWSLKSRWNHRWPHRWGLCRPFSQVLSPPTPAPGSKRVRTSFCSQGRFWNHAFLSKPLFSSQEGLESSS